jgi:hypothetical protein
MIMKPHIGKSIAVFSRPFRLSGFDEILPAGEYDIETELNSPPDHLDPAGWKASVLVHLKPRTSHPGLKRSLTVSLAELESVHARDKLSGRDLTQVFIEEMLEDPMVRLVMKADGVSERQLRHLYGVSHNPNSGGDALDRNAGREAPKCRPSDKFAVQAAENEGMPSETGCTTQFGSPPPGGTAMAAGTKP